MSWKSVVLSTEPQQLHKGSFLSWKKKHNVSVFHTRGRGGWGGGGGGGGGGRGNLINDRPLWQASEQKTKQPPAPPKKKREGEKKEKKTVPRGGGGGGCLNPSNTNLCARLIMSILK